ncbi:MAG TPA: malto-oligosyltrehalose synthase [Ktedonobacterales bacterium]|nr:malto-oligosyltrehalose synthase [Ktedonobacterales bacterium]
MPAEPRATYRAQMRKTFNFDDAAAITDYLAALGVSHLYSSPILQASPGSSHGYDVVDPQRVNTELGGAEGHEQLLAALQRTGLRLALDIVPNHMAIGGRENAWWWDVLENGPSSRYAAYFDVDWDPPEARLRNAVLMPILGDHYGRELEAGEIRLAREAGSFIVRYKDHILPIAPRSLDVPLAQAAERCGSDELAFLADTFGQLPHASRTDTASVMRRHRDKEVLRRHLADLCQNNQLVADAIDATLTEINGTPPALDDMLERQNFRLTYWRAADRELDYRRFFDINTLAGLRAEDERVFEDTHSLILRWVEQGALDGLRIDHIDGLRDPEAYLRRLRERAPETWVVVEKILQDGERLPAAWPVAGTTGYEFLNMVGGLFIDPVGEAPLTDLYAEFTGQPADYATIVHEKKLLVLREALATDVNRLTALWLAICQQRWRTRDYTRHELGDALRETIASMPVYRTYVRADAGIVREEDVRIIRETVEAAKARRPDLDPELFSFLSDVLQLRARGDLESELVMRFQQLSGPAMAKGAEDTACYCYNRLVALNEVGGDPGVFGRSVEAFHAACADTQERWPETMLTTSTHDTKRSEDVRARISLLSELPERWGEAVRRWSARNDRLRTGEYPDRNAEYLLYQTLIGAWPLDEERTNAYMFKAVREAKQHTSWTAPNAAYEQALQSFIAGALSDEEFVADLSAFVDELRTPGWVNSLAQTLLKLTAPGVPDIYQGCDLWDLSLVDPDNRRPVDYALRQRLLAELDGARAEDIWARRDEGLPKLWVIRQALATRRGHASAFGPRGVYEPVIARGAKAAHIVAFIRGNDVITVAPRLVIGRGDDWADTTLSVPEGHWRNVLTGDTLAGGDIAVAETLRRFPVALLVRDEQ